jgi:hypothetical protein
VLQRGHQPELLLHAARVLAHALSQDGAVQLEEVAEAVAQRRRPWVQPREGVEDARARQRGIQAQLPRQVADLGQRAHPVRRDVVAHHRDRPRRRADQPEREADEGRLAGAVRAQEAERLAGLDVEVDLDHADRGSVHSREPARRDRVIHSRGA